MLQIAITQIVIATISYNKDVIRAIEFKKFVSPSVKLVVTNNLMEMIIYCHYIIDIRNSKQERQQETIIGVLTDGISWHCFYLKDCDNQGNLQLLLLIVFYLPKLSILAS